MGKTIEPSKSKPNVYPGPIITVYPDPATAEQLKEQYAPLREWLRQRIEAAERMTPEERRQADEEWEKFKTTVNEARGRKVIGDD